MTEQTQAGEASTDEEPERIPRQVWIVLATTVLGWVVTSLDLQLSAFLTPTGARSSACR